MKKKIMIIIPNFKPGGAEKVHVDLANHWYQFYEIVFVVMTNKGSLNKYLNKNIKIIETKSNRLREFIIPLSKNIKDINPDIIVSAMWPLTSISLISKFLSFKKPKLYFVEHCKLSGQYLKDINSDSFFYKMIISITYFFSKKIICVSKCVLEDMINITKLNRKKFKLIYNPIIFNHSNKYNKDDYLSYFKNAKYKVIGVGTLKKQKDFKNLILAFSYISEKLNAKLVIIGSGPERKSLEKLIVNLNMKDRIILIGFQDNIFPWFDVADLYVHSSIYDGLPLTILEALLSGTPIVSTNSDCGPSELLDNGKYGTLVEVSNSKYLSLAIENKLFETTNKDLLKERAREFSIDKISNQYLEVFDK
jgi:glycosyltransferase involved in cell wall biosynthesis